MLLLGKRFGGVDVNVYICGMKCVLTIKLNAYV